MERTWRIEYEYVLYHMLSRGNEQWDIFYAIKTFGQTKTASTGSDLLKDSGIGLFAGNDIQRIQSVLLNLQSNGKPFDIAPNEKTIEKYSRKKLSKKLLNLMEAAV
jgi:hypothetical protein